MIKQKLVISCPASSRSGYGDHARDLTRSLIAMEQYDVKILDQRWGGCPQDALGKDDEDLLSRLLPGNVTGQPDVWIQVTVPNEFQRVGKYNLGITAGMETTMVDHSWVEGVNRMDKVIVPSNHAKQVFEASTFDKHDKNSNKVVGELKCTTPIEVLFEGSDMNVFKKTKEIPPTVISTMSEVKEEFCFLAVGHWLQGDFGHDRKDIGGMVRVFCDSFNGKKKKPALILKTSGATYSVKDREEMIKKLKIVMNSTKNNEVSVYLLHGDMSQEELNGLYNHPKVKAMVSFTHGEGYGRPLQEFSITGKPTIAPGWSGQMDFLSEYGVLLKGQLQNVHDSAAWENVILKESKWFYVDPNYSSAILKDVYKNYKIHLTHTRKQTQYIKDNFTLDRMITKFQSIMENTPNHVELNLPKLEKQNG